MWGNKVKNWLKKQDVEKVVREAEMLKSRGGSKVVMEKLAEAKKMAIQLCDARHRTNSLEKIFRLKQEVVMIKARNTLIEVFYHLVYQDFKASLNYLAGIERLGDENLEVQNIMKEYYTLQRKELPRHLPQDLQELHTFICQGGMNYEIANLLRLSTTESWDYSALLQCIDNLEYYTRTGNLEVPISLNLNEWRFRAYRAGVICNIRMAQNILKKAEDYAKKSELSVRELGLLKEKCGCMATRMVEEMKL